MLKYIQSWWFANDGEGGGKRVVRKPQDAKLNIGGHPGVRNRGFLLWTDSSKQKCSFIGIIINRARSEGLFQDYFMRMGVIFLTCPLKPRL